jgi:amino acid adenylation domain-containing protein
LAASTARSIPERFEEQVTAHRDRWAVRSEHESLTYGSLNEAANRVARAILETAPHTDVVGVFINHGASVIVAMLGILKSGKVFLPLDVRQPLSRARQILDDSGAGMLLSDDQNQEKAVALCHSDLQLVNADGLRGTGSSPNLGLAISTDAPACMTYTSGSTGSPKGVVQTHRNLLSRTETYTELLQLTDQDRLTMLAPCSVAQGLSSALQALLNGACLYPFPLHELGIGELSPWLAGEAITVFVATASTFRHFARTLADGDTFPYLRVIRIGSEQMLAEDFTRFCRHFPEHCVLVCTLGSTEAGPITSYVMSRHSHIVDVVPAGYPVAGAIVRIVDEDGQECDDGEVGEIAVHSRYLSPGYWRGPGQPLASLAGGPQIDGKTFYRTGDLAARRGDGCLEFRGRKSRRVKIRGFRVELEEIERSLSASPMVLEAAVIERGDRMGDTTLAAYVVPRPGQRVTADDLRTQLATRLPQYAIPGSFEFLSSLPRTASGKVQRTALAEPPAAEVRTISQPPRDAVEVCLTHLWEDLLERRPIGTTEDFFELGGHSLLAARLSASIARHFDVKLPLATFLTSPTIERQAQLIRARTVRKQWSPLVPIRTTGSKPPLFCVHLADGNVLAYRDLARRLPSDQPVYGLQARGLDGKSPVNTRIEDMARDYVDAIRQLQPAGPYAICGWSFGGRVAFEIARQLEQHGERVALLALFDTAATGPGRGKKGTRFIAGLPAHLKTIIHDANRLAHVRRMLRTAKQVCTDYMWRRVVLWQRSGRWLPSTLQNVAQASRNARRDYVPGSYCGSVTLFKVARETTSTGRDPLLGWGSLVSGGVTVHEVPGNHFNMVFEPHVRTLAEKMTACLNAAWNRAEPSSNPPTGAGHGADRAA